MSKETNIVDLSAWKQKKEEEELAALREKVDAIMAQWSEELEPKMYPSIFEDDALGTIDWYGHLYPHVAEGFDPLLYNSTGVAAYADIVLEPNIESCSKTLAWVAYILSDMGMTDASDMVEDVIAELEKSSE